MQRQKLTDFPEQTANYLAANMPPSYEMWWVRGVVMAVNAALPTTGSTGNDHYAQLLIFDIDRQQQRTVNLDGAPNKVNFYKNDAVSIFGHRPKGTDGPKPRYILNHNTGYHHKAYYDIVKEDGYGGIGFGTKAILDNWLVVSAKRTAKQKIQKFFSYSAGYYLCVLIFFLACLSLFWFGSDNAWGKFVADVKKDWNQGRTMLWFPAFFVALWVPMTLYAISTRIEYNLANIYKNLSNQIHNYTIRNQVPELGFVIDSRGTDASGLAKD